MQRRAFLQSIAAAPLAGAFSSRPLEAALPKATITRVNIYEPPDRNPSFNQSDMVVTIETDIGITGVGEGGVKDTLEQCAGYVIGNDPFKTELAWQEMYIGAFYPPGREKIHAVGAIDLALWDIKGKALDLPVHQILGGALREHCECYRTGAVPGAAGLSIAERARAAMEAGYRSFRMGAANIPGRGRLYNTHTAVRQIARDAREAREGVGSEGDWCIDFHQRLDYPDAVRACRLIEEYEPYFVEDPVRDEQALEDIPKLRGMTTCPLAHGEEWGQRWDFNTLLANHDIDYIRATLPNVGGITEMMKIAALCETHAIGIVPHFTGPIATAALVNCMSTYPGSVMMEFNHDDPINYLPDFVDFRQGKLYPNDRPGLGVTLDMGPLTKIGEVTEAIAGRTYDRPDGSLTHW